MVIAEGGAGPVTAQLFLSYSKDFIYISFFIQQTKCYTGMGRGVNTRCKIFAQKKQFLLTSKKN